MKKIILSAVLTTLLFACKKNDTPAPEIPKTVYMVGYEKQTNASKPVAMFWKNDVPAILPSGTEAAFPNRIAINGSDTYITGETIADNGQSSKAVYWKNGAINYLPSVDGWNTTLDVSVSGSDTYILFKIQPHGGNKEIKLWKNGTITDVTNYTQAGRLLDLEVIGNDVYILFDNGNIPGYFKNGTRIDMQVTTTRNYATGFFINGSDVHLIGWQWERSTSTVTPTYWKNGVKIDLPNPINGTQAQPESIFVDGTDVYISGFYAGNNPGENGVIYWKNGTPFTLSTNNYHVFRTNISVKNGKPFITFSKEGSSNCTGCLTSGNIWDGTTSKQATSASAVLGTINHSLIK